VLQKAKDKEFHYRKKRTKDFITESKGQRISLQKARDKEFHIIVPRGVSVSLLTNPE